VAGRRENLVAGRLSNFAARAWRMVRTPRGVGGRPFSGVTPWDCAGPLSVGRETGLSVWTGDVRIPRGVAGRAPPVDGVVPRTSQTRWCRPRSRRCGPDVCWEGGFADGVGDASRKEREPFAVACPLSEAFSFRGLGHGMVHPFRVPGPDFGPRGSPERRRDRPVFRSTSSEMGVFRNRPIF